MDWLSNSKEPICYWIVSLVLRETQLFIGLAGQSVKPNCVCMVLLCVSLLFPSGLWNHAQLEGGSDAERLMSTLAYGWVERCSNITSCGPTSLQDHYSCVFTSITVFVL